MQDQVLVGAQLQRVAEGDAQRDAFELEALDGAVAQIAAVGLHHQIGGLGLDGQHRRIHMHLAAAQKADGLSAGRRRLAVLHAGLEPVDQGLATQNAAAVLTHHDQLLQEFFDSLAFLGGERDDGHVGKAWVLEAPFLDHGVEALVVLVDAGVPLGDAHHQALAGFLDLAQDAKVLLLDAVGAVHQEEHGVATAHALQGAHVREILDAVLDLGLLAKSGGVGEHDLASAPVEAGVHRVAGGAGNGRDDHALLAQELVHQRALAGVGASQDGHAHGGALFGRFGTEGRQELLDAFHQPVEAVSGGGRDAMRLAEA